MECDGTKAKWNMMDEIKLTEQKYIFIVWIFYDNIGNI